MTYDFISIYFKHILRYRAGKNIFVISWETKFNQAKSPIIYCAFFHTKNATIP